MGGDLICPKCGRLQGCVLVGYTPEISGDILKFESTHAISGYTPGCDQSNCCSTYPGTYPSMTAATSGYLGIYPEYDQNNY